MYDLDIEEFHSWADGVSGFSSTAYPFLLPLSVTVTSEDLSVDNIQAKVPLERSHNVLAAMLDVLFIVIPGLDGLVGMPGSELFPPCEHAVQDMPSSRSKVLLSSQCEFICLVGADGNK